MQKILVNKISTLAGHQDSVYTIEPSNKENYFFSAAGDGLIAEWNLANPEIGKLIAKIPSSVYALKLIPHKNILVIGQNFEGIQILDLTTHKVIKSIQLTGAAIFEIDHHKNDLIIACGDGVLIIVDMQHWVVRKHIKASEKSARCLAIHPLQNFLAVGYSDYHVRVFDLETFELKGQILAHENSVFALQFSPQGEWLLSTGRDARLKIWDVKNNFMLKEEIIAHLYAINHLMYSPDGKYFATASMDKSIKLWDAYTFKLLKVIDKARHAGHGTSVNKLWWSSYKGQLVSASDDRTLSVWDIQEKNDGIL